MTTLHLQRAGLVQPATKRSAHRKKRPRRPMVGMLLHQDASMHAWFAGDARKHDLIVTMDDATSAIYSAFLVEEEGTASSLRGLREVVSRHGVFCSLYTDRGSHDFYKVRTKRITGHVDALAPVSSGDTVASGADSQPTNAPPFTSSTAPEK